MTSSARPSPESDLLSSLAEDLMIRAGEAGSAERQRALVTSAYRTLEQARAMGADCEPMMGRARLQLGDPVGALLHFRRAADRDGVRQVVEQALADGHHELAGRGLDVLAQLPLGNEIATADEFGTELVRRLMRQAPREAERHLSMHAEALSDALVGDFEGTAAAARADLARTMSLLGELALRERRADDAEEHWRRSTLLFGGDPQHPVMAEVRDDLMRATLAHAKRMGFHGLIEFADSSIQEPAIETPAGVEIAMETCLALAATLTEDHREHMLETARRFRDQLDGMYRSSYAIDSLLQDSPDDQARTAHDAYLDAIGRTITDLPADADGGVTRLIEEGEATLQSLALDRSSAARGWTVDRFRAEHAASGLPLAEFAGQVDDDVLVRIMTVSTGAGDIIHGSDPELDRLRATVVGAQLEHKGIRHVLEVMDEARHRRPTDTVADATLGYGRDFGRWQRSRVEVIDTFIARTGDEHPDAELARRELAATTCGALLDPPSRWAEDRVLTLLDDPTTAQTTRAQLADQYAVVAQEAGDGWRSISGDNGVVRVAAAYAQALDRSEPSERQHDPVDVRALMTEAATPAPDDVPPFRLVAGLDSVTTLVEMGEGEAARHVTATFPPEAGAADGDLRSLRTTVDIAIAAQSGAAALAGALKSHLASGAPRPRAIERAVPPELVQDLLTQFPTERDVAPADLALPLPITVLDDVDDVEMPNDLDSLVAGGNRLELDVVDDGLATLEASWRMEAHEPGTTEIRGDTPTDPDIGEGTLDL